MRNQKNEKENELYNQRIISAKIHGQTFLGPKMSQFLVQWC